jgi:RNA polymerase sigma-70 factor, ECF subfamily
METSAIESHRSPASASQRTTRPPAANAREETATSFDARFVALFHARFRGLFRFLDRLSGEPELAADLAQDTFVRLHERGSFPDQPDAWLITVAMNLFRNVKSTRARRRRLLTVSRAERVLADPSPSPSHGAETDSPELVRRAMARLSDRERQLLLLIAEGCRYRDIATALDLNEASVGTLLSRAKRAFREAYAAEGGTWE